jgi:hypothetical protein
MKSLALRQGRPDVDVPVGVAFPSCLAAASAFAFLFHVILPHAFYMQGFLVKLVVFASYFGLFVPLDYFGSRFDCKKKTAAVFDVVNSALKLPLAFFVSGKPNILIFNYYPNTAKQRLVGDVPFAADGDDGHLSETAPLHALLLAKIVSYFSLFLEGIGIQKSPFFKPFLQSENSLLERAQKRHVRLVYRFWDNYIFITSTAILRGLHALLKCPYFDFLKKRWPLFISISTFSKLGGDYA